MDHWPKRRWDPFSTNRLTGAALRKKLRAGLVDHVRSLHVFTGNLVVSVPGRQPDLNRRPFVAPSRVMVKAVKTWREVGHESDRRLERAEDKILPQLLPGFWVFPGSGVLPWFPAWEIL